MRKFLSFILLASLCIIALASCKDGTIPADPPATKFTLPTVTTEAPETTKAETTAALPAVTEPVQQETRIYATAEEFVADYASYFGTLTDNMLNALAEIEKTEGYDKVEYAITKKSYEMLACTFGDVVYSGDKAATVKMTLTMLDEKAVFDKYMEIISSEDEADINAILNSEDVPTVTESITLHLAKVGRSWNLSDDNEEFKELFSIGQIK